MRNLAVRMHARISAPGRMYDPTLAGNALDRVIHGGVTDFMEVRLWSYIWPAFNLADSVITIGAALVLWELLFPGRQRDGSGQREHS